LFTLILTLLNVCSLFLMSSCPYAAFLPTFDNAFYDPLKPFTHIDPGVQALQQERDGKDSLEFMAGAQVTPLTPALGDEVDGVDLTMLDSEGRDQLALQVARRGVLVFRNQVQFLSKDVEWFKNWGRHFGRYGTSKVLLHALASPKP
jgi:sulfonate dioxygenase